MLAMYGSWWENKPVFTHAAPIGTHTLQSYIQISQIDRAYVPEDPFLLLPENTTIKSGSFPIGCDL